MLLTNQCLNKLAAAQIDFTQHGMLEQSKLNDSLTLIGLSPCFLLCCVTLTSIAELIWKRYNKRPREAVNSKVYLEIVNNPSILAHTELCKRICKWCLHTVISLTQVLDHKRPVTDIANYIGQPELPDLIWPFLYHQLLSKLDSQASDLDIYTSFLPI
jgi:hypothetical protein